MRKLGGMMVKGKGGAMDVNGGIDLWKKAAAKGDGQAQRNIDKFHSCLNGTSFEF